MKHIQKTKAKHRGAKKPTARATAYNRRAPAKTKPRRKQSVSVRRERVDQIPVMPVVEPKLVVSNLFWPVLPFAMMRMWWGSGKVPKGT